jgi:hypothetical protein
VNKRLVFQHPSGLMQIFGHQADDAQPPSMLVYVAAEAPLCLVAAKRSYYLYKPLMLPRTRSDFNPESFNPGGGTTFFNSGQR